MKNVKNLVLLLVAISFFSSCLVQDGRGRGNGPRHHHHGQNHHNNHGGW